MLSRLLKPPSKETLRKGGKDESKESSLHDLSSRVRQEDSSTPHTPRTPRLERARNRRRHLVEFEDIPRLSIASYSVGFDSLRHELSSSAGSETKPPPDVENKADKADHKARHRPQPESSSETTSKSSASSRIQQTREFDDCGEDDKTSSEYNTDSSSGSPPTIAKDVGVAWEGPGPCTKAERAFAPRARRKASTAERPQSNGPDKLKPLSITPSPQKKAGGHRPASPLPIPSSRKVLFEEGAVQDVPQTGQTALKNFSGPLHVRNKRDHSPNYFSRNPLVSLHGPEVTKPSSYGRKGAGSTNPSGPLFMQPKRDISSFQSPQRSPLQSPQRSPLQSPQRSPLQSPGESPFVSPKFPGSAFYSNITQVAHPLPLPRSVNTAPVSPRSNTSSADRSEDSSKNDPPLVPGRTSSCPSGAVSVPSSGRWVKGALLGSGSFGKVYRGHHSETGDMCAIKEVEIIADDPRSTECANQLAQEVALLSMLRHPNILHYKGSEMVNGERLYIYLELVSGGSIHRLLQEFNSFAEPVIRRYTRQILLGLQFLHDRSTVHRDIKCANILVDQDGRVKLADFGMAKLIGKEPSPLSFKGSPYWMAPEVILQNNVGHESAVDIWSLGCTVIEMATGKPPWHKYEGYAAMFKVMNCHEVPIPDSLSPIGKNFVRLCLQRDPSKRPSAAMLLEHPFVQLEQETSYPSQAVNDNLFQGMMKKDTDHGSMGSSGMPSQPALRNSIYQYPRGGRPTGPSPHKGNIPSSRSAIQLSDYSKPQSARDTRRLGRLTDTEEDIKNPYESPIRSSGIQGTQTVKKHMDGLDLQRTGQHSPKI